MTVSGCCGGGSGTHTRRSRACRELSLRTHGQTDRQTDRQTDSPASASPWPMCATQRPGLPASERRRRPLTLSRGAEPGRGSRELLVQGGARKRGARACRRLPGDASLARGKPGAAATLPSPPATAPPPPPAGGGPASPEGGPSAHARPRLCPVGAACDPLCSRVQHINEYLWHT